MDRDEEKPVFEDAENAASGPESRTARASQESRTSLWELAALFGRLGATAFGGPAAHIAMMADDVVRRRGWMNEERFLDLVGATNLIPGPNSTEMAIHIGWERRRWAGLAVAGLSFIVPAVAITGALAWIYLRYGSVPQARWLLYGLKPVIIAVIAQAVWMFLPRAVKTARLKALGCAAVVASWAGVHELAVLMLCGAISTAVRGGRVDRGAASTFPLLWSTIPAAGAAVSGTLSATSLFAVFFKIGAVLFGSGYVLLAFLRADLVERLGWLTEAQLIDAVAVGQLTPGPVFTTATFIGYVVMGAPGALAATAGIFLPAFIFVALSGPLVPRIRESARAGAFLDGVNAGSLALMVVVLAQLGRVAVVDGVTAVLCVISAVLLFRFRLNSVWLLLIGAATGFAAHAAGWLVDG